MPPPPQLSSARCPAGASRHLPKHLANRERRKKNTNMKGIVRECELPSPFPPPSHQRAPFREASARFPSERFFASVVFWLLGAAFDMVGTPFTSSNFSFASD